MIEVHGKYGVYAKVLKHSISPAGVNLITFEVSYWRGVLAELNTHGMLARNSSSSRAIPFAKMVENLTGRPHRFGANQPGMQDKGEDFRAPVRIPGMEANSRAGGPVYFNVEDAWATAREDAISWAEVLHEAGYHKQVVNRLTEPFQMMKTVITATETANFYWLRNHDAADPSLQELARCMYEAAQQSTGQALQSGEWHLPYVETGLAEVHDNIQCNTALQYWIEGEQPWDKIYLTLEEAIAVSSARCAAVSFRNVDYGVEKSQEVFKKLTSDLRVHGSAFEHQATPMKACSGEEEKDGNIPGIPETWEPGVTHAGRDGQLWSAKFRGWRMHRKLIPGENKPGFLLEESQC